MSRPRPPVVLVAIAMLLMTAHLSLAPAAAAQAPPSSTGEVPTQEIVPKPNSGTPPSEAGDRGGALQLGVLALVVAGVGLAVLHLRRQSQRARAGRGQAPPAT